MQAVRRDQTWYPHAFSKNARRALDYQWPNSSPTYLRTKCGQRCGCSTGSSPCTRRRRRAYSTPKMIEECILHRSSRKLWNVSYNKYMFVCSDVSSAFDKVQRQRLEEKLKAKGFHPTIVGVLSSWLRDRPAHVVVGGKLSGVQQVKNMVYQGTALGPGLWNIMYEDVRRAVESGGSMKSSSLMI